MALTIDDINAALAAAGINDVAGLNAFIANTAALSGGAHAAGLDKPGALNVANLLVQRESLNALLTVTGQQQMTGNQAYEAKKQQIGAQIATVTGALATAAQSLLPSDEAQ